MSIWNYMAIDETWSRPWEKSESFWARDIIDNYGWDVYRLYEMMRGEPDEDWDEGIADGSFKFVSRLYRIISDVDPKGEQNSSLKEILDSLHTDLKGAFFHPRSAGLGLTVAALMKAVKEIHALGADVRIDPETAKWLLLFNYPFVPHTVAELWKRTFPHEDLKKYSWRLYAEAAEHLIELPLQVNGKVRGHIKTAADSSLEEIRAAAVRQLGLAERENEIRFIYIKGKMLSLVIPQE